MSTSVKDGRRIGEEKREEEEGEGMGSERERGGGRKEGLQQAQRILLFDFSLKPVHLVHGHTLMVTCQGEHMHEREIPVITRQRTT